VQANLLLHHPADARSYGVATSILVDLNLPRIALLTNNPDKIIAVEGPNKEVIVEKRVKMIPKAWRGEVGVEGKEVGEYLKTKVTSTPVLVHANVRLLKWVICWIYLHNRDLHGVIYLNVHYQNIHCRSYAVVVDALLSSTTAGQMCDHHHATQLVTIMSGLYEYPSPE